jgi:hypothetical protein
MGDTRIRSATSTNDLCRKPRRGDDVASETAGERSGRWRWRGLVVAVTVWFAVAACTDADTDTESETGPADSQPPPITTDTETLLQELDVSVVLFDERGQGYWCPGGYHPTCPAQCVSALEAQRLDGLTLGAVRGTALATAALDLECLGIADAHVVGEALPGGEFRVLEITAGGEHLVLGAS